MELDSPPANNPIKCNDSYPEWGERRLLYSLPKESGHFSASTFESVHLTLVSQRSGHTKVPSFSFPAK